MDILAQIEEIAANWKRTRSWVMVRALKSYLAAEGREILDIAQAKRDFDAGHGTDMDDVIAELEATT